MSVATSKALSKRIGEICEGAKKSEVLTALTVVFAALIVEATSNKEAQEEAVDILADQARVAIDEMNKTLEAKGRQ